MYSTSTAEVPAEIIVTDRFGHRVGDDPSTGTTFDEIPGASSFGDGPINELDTSVVAIPAAKEIHLADVSGGPYQVTVIGTGSGGYELEVVSRDASQQYNTVVVESTTYAGKIEHYIVTNDPNNSGSLSIRLLDK